MTVKGAVHVTAEMLAAEPQRYQAASMQRVFATLLILARHPESEIYNKDGSQRTGANVRYAFWDGFNGITEKHRLPPESMVWAAHQAGKEHARRVEKEGLPKPAIRAAVARVAPRLKSQTLENAWG